MKLKGKFKFIGIQSIQGKKDPTKTYYNVVLLQETDTVKIFLDEKSLTLFQGINQMDELECTLNINIGINKSYIGIHSVSLSKPAKVA